MHSRMGRMTRRLIEGSAAIASIAVLAACGSTVTSGTTSTAGVAASYTAVPTSIGDATKFTKPIPTGLKVVVALGSTPQSATFLKGVQSAGGVLGWNVSSMTFDQSNPASITSTIDSAIAQKPDAIVVVGLQNATFASSLELAHAAGIPIISAFTADPGAPGLYPLVRTGIEAEYTTKAMTTILLGDAKTRGVTAHVLQLTVPAVGAVFAGKNQGMQTNLAQQCSKCTWASMDIAFPDVFNGQLPSQVVSYLQAHPDVNYVIADAGNLANGLDSAFSQAGMTNVRVFGFDASTVQLKQLQSGAAGAWTVGAYQVDGWMAADLIARIKTGGDTAIWDHAHPDYVVTAANAATANAQDPEFPSDYQNQFKALWGK